MERLLHMIKVILQSVTSQQHLDDEGLQMVMCEVEAVLNSRPLTTVSDNPTTWSHQHHLLQLKVQPVLPPGLVLKEYTRRRWRQTSTLQIYGSENISLFYRHVKNGHVSDVTSVQETSCWYLTPQHLEGRWPESLKPTWFLRLGPQRKASNEDQPVGATHQQDLLAPRRPSTRG
ncbi:hypothetical protein N1851_029442 [Merluccius polli]|uniref:Uncharacterized protein n=1 Tax=Merluccius polli TaxID=89951 RepID=A0AA47NSM7_MERPO|nr:hypothetical protein N1851_029442 [Merluccius polli]